MLRLACEPRAEGMDALTVRLEQARHRILGQPVHLQVWMQFAQFPGDGDVSAPVPKPNGRGEIERPFGIARSASRSRGNGRTEHPIEEIDDQGVALCWEAPEWIVTATRDGHEFGAGSLRYGLRPRIGLYLVVVAVDHQHGTTDFAIHRLADVERRRYCARFYGFGQYRARGISSPADAVLNLLGGVRF